MRAIFGLSTALILGACAHSATAAVVGALGGGFGVYRTLSAAGLDGGTLASLSGGAVITGPLASPTFGGTYLSASAASGQAAVITFNVPTTYFSFTWGSPTASDQLIINSTGNSQLFTATSLGFPLINGNPNFEQVVLFASAPGDVITSASFSNSNAFDTFDAGDFNTISTAATVPEPAAWLMMLLGFGGMGLVLRHRRLVAVGSGAVEGVDVRSPETAQVPPIGAALTS